MMTPALAYGQDEHVAPFGDLGGQFDGGKALAEGYIQNGCETHVALLCCPTIEYSPRPVAMPTLLSPVPDRLRLRGPFPQ
ncbi:MAG: hypothetical protein WBR29_03310, partial [Gammaproteobacteria bacterium]